MFQPSSQATTDVESRVASVNSQKYGVHSQLWREDCFYYASSAMSNRSKSPAPSSSTWDNAFLLTIFAVLGTGVLVSLKRFLPIIPEDPDAGADD
jgi:hypothetical protein